MAQGPIFLQGVTVMWEKEAHPERSLGDKKQQRILFCLMIVIETTSITREVLGMKIEFRKDWIHNLALNELIAVNQYTKTLRSK